MLRFKRFLVEGISKGNSDPNAVGRRIFDGLPPNLMTHATPIYNAITTRPIDPQFGAFDSSVQGAWRDPRKGIVGTAEAGWDHMKAGIGNLADVKAASPSYALGDTFKRYWSVADVHDPKIIERWGAAVPELRDRMSGVADQFKTAFTFKVPEHASTAGKHVDSIVAHHYGLPDTSLTRSMDATTRQWAKDSGLRLLDRRGLDVGVDVGGRSFSELMAAEIAKQNYDAKYRGKQVQRSLSQIGQDIVNSEVARVAGKAGKFLPVVGIPLAAAAITQRAQAGDYVGAGLEAASEVADSVPVLGTPISAGIQGYLGYHDMTPEEQEQFRKNRGAKPTEQSRRKAEETYSRQNY